jgi:CheY-like chemotaxis protein
MKLLVVDDHPLIREALQHVLRALGVSVELLEAETCVQAMERTRHNQDSSLILLDRALPGVDGFEALRQLREESPRSLSSYSRRTNNRKRLGFRRLPPARQEEPPRYAAEHWSPDCGPAATARTSRSSTKRGGIHGYQSRLACRDRRRRATQRFCAECTQTRLWRRRAARRGRGLRLAQPPAAASAGTARDGIRPTAASVVSSGPPWDPV